MAVASNDMQRSSYEASAGNPHRAQVVQFELFAACAGRPLDCAGRPLSNDTNTSVSIHYTTLSSNSVYLLSSSRPLSNYKLKTDTAYACYECCVLLLL